MGLVSSPLRLQNNQSKHPKVEFIQEQKFKSQIIG